jgi:O-antigen/teichoic acid export membrane protein
MLWILIPPLLSCSVGFSGNIIVMTGHSLWNLINSVSVAGLNVLFNYWLIPDHGLEGAAVATALAALIFSVAQLVEARMLVGARLLVGQIYKPWLAAVPATLIAVGITYWMGDAGVVIRSGAFAVAVLSYLLVLNGMGIEAKDRDIFFNRRKPPENTD